MNRVSRLLAAWFILGFFVADAGTWLATGEIVGPPRTVSIRTFGSASVEVANFAATALLLCAALILGGASGISSGRALANRVANASTGAPSRPRTSLAIGGTLAVVLGAVAGAAPRLLLWHEELPPGFRWRHPSLWTNLWGEPSSPLGSQLASHVLRAALVLPLAVVVVITCAALVLAPVGYVLGRAPRR